MQRKMYLLVLESLSAPQKAVQSSHATAEFMHQYGSRPEVSDWVQNDRTMVILSVDEKQLDDWEYRLNRRQLPFATFFEPDVDKKTALAVVADHDDGKLFRKLPMIQGDN